MVIVDHQPVHDLRLPKNDGKYQFQMSDDPKNGDMGKVIVDSWIESVTFSS